MDTQIKPGTPFRRALLMYSVLTSLATQFKGLALQQAVGAVGAYEGRGKGRGKYSGKKPGNKTGRTYASNGVRECARRVRQIEKACCNVPHSL